jgi:hypothetical protein
VILISRVKIPQFESNELNPKVLKLFEIIQQQGEAIEQLREEVAQLKGHKGKPMKRRAKKGVKGSERVLSKGAIFPGRESMEKVS